MESLRPDLTDAQKISIFETQQGAYEFLQKVLIAQNKTNSALEVAERGRARAFVELLSQKLSNNPNNLPALKPTLTQIQQIAKAQNATLVQYSIIREEFKIGDKQEWRESELYIWVINPAGVVTFRKADLKPLWQQQNTNLAKLVTVTRESIGVRGLGIISVELGPEAVQKQQANQTQSLQKLHQLLIAPIADLLPSDANSPVVFIPQQALFLVPFAALQDEKGTYLIDKHTILTAPSIQVLELTRKQRQTVLGKEMLIVGNPTMPSISLQVGEEPVQLSELKGAETEAQEIAKLFNTQPLIGSQATETAIKQQIYGAKIVHLATHGLIDDFGFGVPGAVALAPGGKEDGLLTSGEILDLKINAELVVLSACDTGRGEITGDGVIGLSRSLISAGTPTVIVSLWAVPDAPTANLMSQFYRNLQQDPNKAQALRQAMLTTKQQHPNPRDWAAFTVIGEAE
nr:CHAT domain-containing protein [Microcoleus sp. FACHB-68]